MKVIKTILKVLLAIVIVLIVLVGALLGWLTAVEYKPADTEQVAVKTLRGQAKTLKAGDSISLVAWNLGYAALGDNADFFMDGGKMVYSADEARVRENLNAIINEVKATVTEVITSMSRSFSRQWISTTVLLRIISRTYMHRSRSRLWARSIQA